MICPDINLLLYSINESYPDHSKAKSWWDGVLSGPESVHLLHVVVLGFLRLSTHPKVFVTPLKPKQATDIVDLWLAQPNVRFFSPNDEYWEAFKEKWLGSQGGASISTDAHIAAAAITKGLMVYSNDSDFARFNGLKCINPLK